MLFLPRIPTSPCTTHRRVLPLLGAVCLVAAVLLAGAVRPVVAAPASLSPWDVVRDSGSELVLRVRTAAPRWREVSDDRGRRYRRPLLPGFVTTGDPGTPAVPAAGAWIVVPDGTRPEVVPGDRRWQPLAGEPLPPVPVPVRLPPADGLPDGRRVERYLWRGEQPAAGTVLVDPERWAGTGSRSRPAGLTVGEPVRWRDRWIAPVTVRPLAVDGAGRAQRLLVEGTWTIRFVPDPSRRAGATAAARNDARFQGLFLNGERLREAPPVTPAAAAPRPRTVKAAPLFPEVRLPVSRTGLQRVTARQLQNAGLLPASGVAEAQLRLYQRRYLAAEGITAEIEVPLLVEGDGGDFTGDDAIVFYGLRPRDDRSFERDGIVYPDCGDTNETYNPVATDPVNGGNIYYLQVSDPPAGGWSRMAHVSLPPATGNAPDTYQRSDYLEQDQYFCRSPYDAHVDRNHWNSRYAAEVIVPLDPVSPGTGVPLPVLQVRLLGFGDPRTYQLDLLDADGNVVRDLGEVTAPVTGTTAAITITDVNDLVGARLRVAKADPPFLMSGYLDWVRLDYPARYAARDNRLDFHAGQNTGTVHLRVTGFTGGPLTLLDVSDPRAPQVVDLAPENVVDAGDGTLTLSIAVTQAAPHSRRFLAYGSPLADALPAYPVFQASRVSGDDPLAVASPPDLLVVTHPDFRALAEQWADWRSAHTPGGLSVHVVDVHDLYDRFSGGLKNPVAIRRFCLYALDHWGSWALQIVGDATENVRQLHDPYDLRDWVPSYLEVWRQAGYANEILPVDKWFVTPAAGPDYPYDTAVPPSMVVGRFPVQNTAELQAILDKLAAFTAADDGPAWKRRAVFIADDAWGAGYDIGGTEQNYSVSEESFQESEEQFAALWESFLGDAAPVAGLTADRQFLAPVLEPVSPPHDQVRDRQQFIDYAEQLFVPGLLASLGQGALLARYQGHANDHLLAHEQIFEDFDDLGARHDVAGLDNTGRPFVFVGLGCHIGAFGLGDSEGRLRVAQSLSEKLLVREGAGACAAYASPGYEFLTPNVALAGVQAQDLLVSPPRFLLGDGTGRPTRWVLGEVLLKSEMDFLALAPSSSMYRRAVAQYALLGDPLLQLDAGPPLVTVTVAGDTLVDGTELTANDPAGTVTLSVEAWDEAGIARLAVLGSDGTDYAGGVTGGPAPGSTTDQHHRYTVLLPVEPYDHDVVLHVFDSADAAESDTHYQLTLHVPLRVELTSGGEPFDPEQDPLLPGEPRTFTGTVTTGAWLAPEVSTALTGEHAAVTGASVVRQGPHSLSLQFTAEADGLGTPRLLLQIDGHVTPVPLGKENNPPPGGTLTVDRVNVFPNPVRDRVRFLFATNATGGHGRIEIFSVAGRPVARIPFTLAGDAAVVVPWDGRDDRGDRLANGVYLYRVVVTAAGGGSARSDMQRLVVMR